MTFLDENLIYWKSKRSGGVATSTTVAELESVYMCLTHMIWERDFLRSLGLNTVEFCLRYPLFLHSSLSMLHFIVSDLHFLIDRHFYLTNVFVPILPTSDFPIVWFLLVYCYKIYNCFDLRYNHNHRYLKLFLS